MSPFPVDPRWYEEYWMTEQRSRLARLAAALRHLAGAARSRSRADLR
jgi:hypothetical protein